jgi:hypothetical protein
MVAKIDLMCAALEQHPHVVSVRVEKERRGRLYIITTKLHMNPNSAGFDRAALEELSQHVSVCQREYGGVASIEGPA